MRCSMRSIVTASSLLLLAACVGRPTPEPAIQYREAAVAVAAGCVGDRPAAPAPLNVRVPAAEWATRAPGAKAQAIRAQGGLRLNYEDRQAAALSGCGDRQP